MSWEEKVPDDIALCKRSEWEKHDVVEAYQHLARVVAKRPNSIVVEVNEYRKYVPLMIKTYIKMSELSKKASMQADRCTNVEYDRANKRWSKDEDNELIEKICDGKHNIHQISVIFGRSPGAIKTHISELVGRKRLSQEIAGRFIGTINGKEMNADISGTLFKED